MTLSALEQTIYNTHLKYSRNGNPWKPRKDFSDIDNSTILFLKKLSIFFTKFNHIKINDFFEAPLILHPEEKYPPLKYFITRAAIKSFSLSEKKKIDQSPDLQIESIKQGFEFIAKFCLQQKIELEQYPLIKNFNMPIWLEHYRLHLVNPYCFLSFKNIEIDSLNREELDFWAPNLKDIFSTLKIRLHSSTSAKTTSIDIYNRLSKFISSELKKNNSSL